MCAFFDFTGKKKKATDLLLACFLLAVLCSSDLMFNFELPKCEQSMTIVFGFLSAYFRDVLPVRGVFCLALLNIDT